MVIKKLISFICIAALSLIASEVALTIFSNFYRHYQKIEVPLTDYEKKMYHPSDRFYDQDNTAEIYTANDVEHIIITAGDSFTNGGNIQPYKTYPFKLFKLLESKDTKIQVINIGSCEESSAELFERLMVTYSKLSSPIPKYLVILVGAADFFNYRLSYLDSSENFASMQNLIYQVFLSPNRNTVIDWALQLKTLKVLRGLWLQLFTNHSIALTGQASQIQEHEKRTEYIKQMKLLSDEFLQRKITNEEKNGICPKEKIELYTKMQNLIMNINPNVYEMDLKPYRIIDNWVKTQALLYSQTGQFASALRLVLSFLNQYPALIISERFFKEYEGVNNDKVNEVNSMERIITSSFQLQSELSASEVSLVLKNIENSNPESKNLKVLTYLIQLFGTWQKTQEEISVKRISTYEKILSFCKHNNIKLIIQNYPNNYSWVNHDILEFAQKHSIEMVDNFKTFSTLLSEIENLSIKYFADDNHLTELGYSLMAQNVYDHLLRYLNVPPP